MTETQDKGLAEFYAKVRELISLVEGLGQHKARRAMDLVMELKNSPRFLVYTINREEVPDDISSLCDETQKEED